MILKHGWKVPSYCSKSNYLKLGYDQFGGWLDQSNHLGHLDLFTAMQCIAQLLRLDCSHCTSVPGAKKMYQCTWGGKWRDRTVGHSWEHFNALDGSCIFITTADYQTCVKENWLQSKPRDCRTHRDPTNTMAFPSSSCSGLMIKAWTLVLKIGHLLDILVQTDGEQHPLIKFWDRIVYLWLWLWLLLLLLLLWMWLLCLKIKNSMLGHLKTVIEYWDWSTWTWSF